MGSPVSSPAVGVAGTLASIDVIRERAAEAARGVAPMALAADDLLTWAATAVHAAPHPVQPLVVVGNDNELVDDATRVYGLGLAYVATGDEQFATGAAETISSWVETVHWADDTCTDSGGCHTTLSISRAAPGFVFGASLIADSPAWTTDRATAFRSWLRSVILPAASERPNNWGDAGTFMRVAVADYLGDEAAFGAAIDKWRSSLDLIEPSGRIPEESRRGTAGISYTQEALQYKLAVAQIAERRGIDLWDAVGAGGGSLKIALDRLAYFCAHPAEWPDAANAEVPAPGPAWELAYAHWRDPAWAPLVLAVRPYGDRGHSAIRWTTFTNGVPIDPITAAGSPSPSSSAEPSAGGSSEPSASPDDPAPPVLTAIRARLVVSAAMGDVAVRVSWSAPRSADRVRLEWSSAGSWHGLVASDRDRGSIIDARSPGTVSYRGRLTRDGVTGPWLELRDVTTARIDARSTTLALHGAWSMAGGDGYSSGTALSTDQPGASATWKGTASDLLIIGPVGPTRGEMEVIVDGKLADRISLRANAYRARQVLDALHWTTPGSHTVVIRASGGAGRTVAVDELVRLDAGSLSSPASTP
ncbi:MAG TPA: alginate lyase family protein [Candidatus Limnocylindrales bacterium]|nr:alginate lyase family protein [Candidatus Limnocylindrales bacterium]